MDHYKVLGIHKNASKDEIKEAFRKLALQFHPDKHSHSSKHVRDNAILKFKQASQAYEVLTDDSKRAQYNGGGSSRPSSGGGGNGGYSYRPRYSSSSASSSASRRRGFDFHLTLQYMTSRAFLRNLAFASVLLGGALIVETSGDALWKAQNSGKSFEEAVESIEKKRSESKGR
ncbi:hypothetical protein ACHQM5_018462 [Ranunculus cassubicifolius]